ncbi:MAG: T9SS type A sorting domain-containing protein [Ferruginibacter sp.]
MKKIICFILCLALIPSLFAQSINKLEYFIDNDPGFGNATNISIVSSANISNLVVPVGIASLSKGLHSIYFRSKDNAGNWSLTNRWMFLKDVLSSNANKLEYFIDTDPGFGNGINITITPSANIIDIAVPVSISSLSKGFHSIYTRSKDNTGSWSITNRWLFFKDLAQANLSGGEYFFDTDPGFGHGTAIPFTGPLGTGAADFSFVANASSLTSTGNHLLFIRTREVNGKWSLTNVLPFDYSGPLPVSLLNFKVKAEGKHALLNWQTSSEQNSARFDIERSIDAIRFEKIGSVKAAGNSSSQINYSFIDHAPKNGINYYRLREVDLDGHAQYSELRKATFNEVPALTLYNNFSNGQPVKVNVNVFPSVLTVFNASGKKVKETDLTANQYYLPVIDFANGVYIAVLNNGGKVLAVEQFVVNK